MPPSIRIENVSKLYRLGEVGTGTLSHDLHRAWARLRGKPDPFAKVGQLNDRTVASASPSTSSLVPSTSPTPSPSFLSRLSPLAARNSAAAADYVWALKDINLEIEQGEIVGIIGSNGAGKSTLLKLLSRITEPTTGRIRTKGRIASLLEVGTGFHPELTGRENIYLNGSILGMRRHEITNHLDEIVEFSGCEKYIDTPVKRYSSGMTVRLGFSVAAHLNCEILIVDEVLAVGDIEFQKKCLGKMKDISYNSGRTILFVTHNLGSIHNLCSRCLLISQGTLGFSGIVDEAISLYIGRNIKSVPSIHNSASKPPLNSEIRLTSAEIKDCKGTLVEIANTSDQIFLEVRFKVTKAGQSYAIAAELISAANGPVLTSSSLDMRPSIELGTFTTTGDYSATWELPISMLKSGRYLVKVSSTIPAIKILDEFPELLSFELNDNSSPIAVLGEGRTGLVVPRFPWSIDRRLCKSPACP